jgi:hypothetical protein
MTTQTNHRKKQAQRKFGVASWKDCHGVDAFFYVVDKDGHRYGRLFPSEAEAEAEAMAAAKKTRGAAS